MAIEAPPRRPVRRRRPTSTQLRPTVSQFVAGAILQALSQASHAAPPALPTPCFGGPCGTNTASTSFVTAGQASATVTGNTLNVTQTTNAAILNWQSFNIAAGNSVNFKQPGATAAALNRIWDANPSTIAGQLTANGQIYLINHNGIIFANGAQVNAGALTASTLDVPDQLFLNGLLSGNNSPLVTGGQLPPVFQAAAGTPPGAVTVQPGAQIQTADGGRVMLLGSTVTNGGKISTPDGQTILGAGTTVYLASTTDPMLRGLLIAVDGQELAANSTVTNTGQITADRGNVTLAGLVVNQAGTLSATTSVNSNGSIYLVAGDADPAVSTGQYYSTTKVGFTQGQLLPSAGGTLTLAPGSVTEVQPDSTDTGTITSAQAFYPSQVNLVGKTIALQGNASVTAPGGQVDAVASSIPFTYVATASTGQSLPAQADGSRIYLDSGSTIDVSGLQEVSAPASQNLVQIELGANELQDDPLLRSGFLHGSTVTVDIAQGTPLLNAATLQSYASTIGHTVQEELTTGGSINLSSGGDVITRAGSTQNVSGGSIGYQSSPGATTKLIGADGKVYDIGSAPNSIQYVGFANSYSYTDPRWGITTSFSPSGIMPGYLQGSAAGTIAIASPDVYLGGSMLAVTTPGLYQRTSASLPQGGAFSLGDSPGSGDATGKFNLVTPSVDLVGSFTDTLGTFDPAASLLPEQNAVQVDVGDLAANGFNRIAVFSNGTITLLATTNLSLPGNGSLTLEGGAVTLAGSIRSPGSSVTAKTDVNLVGQLATDASPIVLTNGASIDVSGNWVNDSPDVTTAVGTAPTLYNGGSVALNAGAQNSVILQAGSSIDVSGGAWVNAANKLTDGAAGSIVLAAGGPIQASTLATAGVTLDGTLRGASLNSGGSLSVSSAWVTVGGDPDGRAGALSLAPEFFTQGGFANYHVTGIDGLTLGSSDPGKSVVIAPLEQSLFLSANPLLEPTGTSLASFTTLETLAQEYRHPASVSFATTLPSFSLPGAGNLTMNSGVSIATDPGATVTLNARENLSVLGSISAPAGTINLQVAPGVGVAVQGDDIDGYVADQQLLIGPTARLSATGFAAIYTNQNSFGYRQGQVLAGGTINVLAFKGSVLADSGAVLDVSGASGVVDEAQQGLGIVPTTIAAAAGTIDIGGRENVVLNSTLRGSAANVAGAAGGSLVVSIGTVGSTPYSLQTATSFDAASQSEGVPLYPLTSRNLILTSQTGLPDTLPTEPAATDPTQANPTQANPTQANPTQANPTQANGIARISTATIGSGGFDSIRLLSPELITLDGAPMLAPKSSLVVDALEIAATPGTRATLGSAYVALGSSVYWPTGQGQSGELFSPLSGDASLSVTASLIDLVGNSTLSGFQSAALTSSGDLRLTYAVGANDTTDYSGSLKSSADLTLKATQIYPTTGADFTINPADAGQGATVDPTLASSYTYTPGAVTIFPGAGGTSLPLSALGDLTINSPQINQYGVLRAPFGQITLSGAGPQGLVALHAGSETSVSGAGEVIPYGSTQNGQQWTYLNDNQGTTSVVGSLSPKQVNAAGADVVIDSNANVDLSGGGDLYAYEFIAGTGGSKDVLLPGNGNSYAILPTLGSSFAPLDHQYSIGSNIAVGSDIYLSGVPGLATGYYALLPARYALLPGAFAVQLVTANSDILGGSAVVQPGGAYLAAGRFAQAGTDVIDSRNSTFLLTPDSVVRNESQYTDSYANTFFSAAAQATNTTAVDLPADAGQLQLSASAALRLQGNIGFAPAEYVAGKDSNGTDITKTGLGGVASIIASQIEVTEPGAPVDGSLQLTASSLNQLGASTLILGASRTVGATADTLNVGAASVSIENSNADPLSAPEIILAATQSVQLASGSSLKATGSSTDSVATLDVAGDGALLRISSGPQAAIVRSQLPSTPQGALTIASGAAVSGTSLILDAAANTSVAPDVAANVSAVEASSSHISLGAVPEGTAGLNVTSELLDTFTGLTALALRSSSTIDFYGAVALGSTTSSGAPTLQSVTLDASGIAGYGAGDKTIEAGAITLLSSGGSSSGPVFAQTPNGTGQLALSAIPGGSTVASGSAGAAGATAGSTTTPGSAGAPGSALIFLGAGAKEIAGFGAVMLSAAGGDIRGQGVGSLDLINAGNLTLQSARISTDAAAHQSITNTTGSVGVAMLTGATSPQLGAAGLGGTLSIAGTSAAGSAAMTVSGLIDIPSGSLALLAQGGGDITLNAGSEINAAGAANPYFDTFAVAPGGSVLLAAQQGSVNILSGATVDVSGATSPDGKVSGAAGSLTVLVPAGQLNLSGTLKGGAAAGQQSGSFTLDTAGNPDHWPFTLVALNLNSDGFEGAVSIRDRGDAEIDADGTLKASSIQLTADSGRIAVFGTLDTSGPSGGGDISLWSAGGLTLSNGSLLTAAALPASGSTSSARGGNITLASTGGTVNLVSGSTVDISGFAGTDNPGVNPDGSLRIEAGYSSSTGTVNVNPIAATIRSSHPAVVIVDGDWSYNVASLGTTGALTPATLSSDVSSFAAQASGIAATVAPAGSAFTVQVRPGINVDSPGDLTLTSNLDLHSLANTADGGVPIDLTLRAAGNLIVKGSLSDGFAPARPNAALPVWSLAAGDSGSYQLAAGADFGSANPLATQRGSGNFILSPGMLIRTGNGNIDIAAGHDVCLGCNTDDTVSTLATAQQSVIYTAGVPSTNAPSFFTAPSITVTTFSQPEFPTGGGDISVTAVNDIVSAPTTDLVSNWLWRQGNILNNGTVVRDTAWWIESSAFQQGIGALGGGNVAVQAGGDIINLSAVIPTNGRLGVTGAGSTTFAPPSLVVDGGGNLTVSAGGSIESGLFEDDLGHASIRAGAAIEPAAPQQAAAVLVLADSTFDVASGGDLSLDGVLNSTALAEANANHSNVASAGLGANTNAYFYTYSAGSTVNLTSAGGKIDLSDNIDGVVAAASGGAPLDSGYNLIDATAVYPASLNVAALSGDIAMAGSAIELFPSASGNLSLLAQQNIAFAPAVSLSEVDPTLVRSVVTPAPQATQIPLALVALPGTPLHESDPVPVRVVAADGDIVQTGGSTLSFPKQADFVAGGNLVNLNYSGKNLGPADVTLFQAGGTIDYDTQRDPATNRLVSNSTGLQVGGPGYVEAIAGQGIDLGDSTGIVTTGRLYDARLPSNGATLVVAAGIGDNADGTLRQPAYDAFISSYLMPGASGAPSAYADDLLGYMTDLYPQQTSLTQSQALAQFSALPRTLQLPFISQVLTDELNATGLAHTRSGASYDRGYNAINTLFPTKDANGVPLTYKGDINMFFSQLKTSQGGDIDLLAPGGAVVVGVPNPPQELSTVKSIQDVNPPISADSSLGLLVLASGAIQGFAESDFDVNQSRILTLQGGNIILWSSFGNIDAGKGAKTAQGAPPPVIETDIKGNVFVNPIGAVSGSGIGQLLTVQGIKPGIVDLIAPTGVVNAGEAGIRVAGDLNIAAVAVLNVGNIKVGGTSTGVPVSDAGALSGALSGASSLGDAGKAVADQLSQSLTAGNNFQALTQSLQPAFIVVRMFCLGVDCDTQ